MMLQSRIRLSRRMFLSSTAVACFLGGSGFASARTIQGELPWSPYAYNPPETLPGGKWYFLTPPEVATLGAITARLIPADDLSISGKDAGCVEFIDRQLAGSWGTFAKYYRSGPFQKGTAYQGDQSEYVPQQRYRLGLAALDKYCRSQHGKGFADLTPELQDQILSDLEEGKITLPDFDGKMFFETVLNNTMEGFFADPIYGGNKDMVSWKMLGFPGARYDYRDYVSKHNQKIDLPPLSIAGRAEWQ